MGTDLFMCVKIVPNSNGMTFQQISIRNKFKIYSMYTGIIQWHKKWDGGEGRGLWILKACWSTKMQNVQRKHVVSLSWNRPLHGVTLCPSQIQSKTAQQKQKNKKSRTDLIFVAIISSLTFYEFRATISVYTM